MPGRFFRSLPSSIYLKWRLRVSRLSKRREEDSDEETQFYHQTRLGDCFNKDPINFVAERPAPEKRKEQSIIMKAYSAFHSCSTGNQILALVQCQMRKLQPGPINTFPKWKDLGRFVKRGEHALT